MCVFKLRFFSGPTSISGNSAVRVQIKFANEYLGQVVYRNIANSVSFLTAKFLTTWYSTKDLEIQLMLKTTDLQRRLVTILVFLEFLFIKQFFVIDFNIGSGDAHLFCLEPCL